MQDTPLPGLVEIERSEISDARGSMSRIFCTEEMAEFGWTKPVAQINRTVTHATGVVRGMHFQRAPHAEMKLVNCLRGAVWDVVIDLRAGSRTFLKWHACELTAANRRALLVPEGFAHGFQALSDDCEMLYVHSAAFASGFEGGLHPQDPMLSIPWPKPIREMSSRDASHPMLDHQFCGVEV